MNTVTIGWIIKIIIWFIMMIIGYNVAKDKNRNALGWAAWCFCFGIFALLVLAFLKPLPSINSNNPY